MPDETASFALLAGERGSQLLAVDNQDDAKQEQSANALFDFQPQWEGAGQRDDGDDGRQHDGRDEPQPEIPAAGAAGHLASKDGRQQGAGTRLLSTGPVYDDETTAAHVTVIRIPIVRRLKA